MSRINFYIAGLLFSALLLGSCEKELLHPVPDSIQTTDNTFGSAKDIDLAVLGIYNSLQSRVPTDYTLMEIPSGNMWAAYFATAPGMDEISTLTVSPQNDKLNSFWKTTYNGIFRANLVLANIDKPVNYAGSEKEQYTGEARFLRAMFYFDLVRIFGGVPAVTSIITVEESKKVPRATEQEIYSLIIKDLDTAVNTLPQPDATPWGRASKGAAVALLAKVYVYLKDWDNAKKYLDQLFSEFDYSLVSHYADLFRLETEQNKEAIYSVPYVAGTNAQTLTYDLAPLGGIFQTITNGNRVGRPTWDLRKEFVDGDTRLPVTIQEEWLPYAHKPNDAPIWFPYFNKWVVPSDPNNSGLDIPLLRLADMILLDAEVLYNLNQPDAALKQINKVRERAFGNTSHDYTLADISTQETFYDKLLLERRLELAVENNRWFDLVRTGRFTTALQGIKGDYSSATGEGAVTVPISAKPYMKYFPIPYEQIQLADPGVLVQNEGY
ncbi:RagB/SusD family nutrient uptake outer membrane protein [Compostibacter hankyongensis]|uniref:RagB/SusD family nutrient uptake outer membrane protein n=1 Tax=Compostibacter hankyongensis TaxID=1007089 RepID=A0ABP8FN84_9BACT